MITCVQMKGKRGQISLWRDKQDKLVTGGVNNKKIKKDRELRKLCE